MKFETTFKGWVKHGAPLYRWLFPELVEEVPDGATSDEALIFWILRDTIRASLERKVRELFPAELLDQIDPEVHRQKLDHGMAMLRSWWVPEYRPNGG